MSENIGLFDRDAFGKLICCDLWAETLAVFRIKLPYRLKSASAETLKKDMRRKGLEVLEGSELDDRINETVKHSPTIPEELFQNLRNSGFLSKLEIIEGIDAGEILLITAAQYLKDNAILISGDKKWMTAFYNVFPNEYIEISEKIFTFEKCLISICQTHGLASIRERLIEASKCDKVLKIALGSNFHHSQAEFIQALRSYDFNPQKTGLTPI